jgi:hypothetical protein
VVRQGGVKEEIVKLQYEIAELLAEKVCFVVFGVVAAAAAAVVVEELWSKKLH